MRSLLTSMDVHDLYLSMSLDLEEFGSGNFIQALENLAYGELFFKNLIRSFSCQGFCAYVICVLREL